MESLFILIPLSLLAVAAAVLVFFRMNSDGQFDDDQGPAMSILMDDDRHTVQDVPVNKSSAKELHK
jgi:cbb3-type cytochrome oxidase maturation protein